MVCKKSNSHGCCHSREPAEESTPCSSTCSPPNSSGASKDASEKCCGASHDNHGVDDIVEIPSPSATSCSTKSCCSPATRGISHSPKSRCTPTPAKVVCSTKNCCTPIPQKTDCSPLESCCSPTAEKVSCSPKSCTPSLQKSNGASKGCCTPAPAKTNCSTKGCCTPAPAKTNCSTKGCCTPGPKETSCVPKSRCADGCCADGDHPKVPMLFTRTAESDVSCFDTEKGISGLEHVILSVSGMDCTGCENKLQRSLLAVEAIRNVKTSFILCKAEFDFDLRAGSVADIIRHIERTTEFKCERVSNEGSEIEVVPDGECNSFLKQVPPPGVIDMEITPERTVRIVFDPNVIGARELVEEGFNKPVGLAPLRPNPGLAKGNKQVRHLGMQTILSTMLTLPVLILAWAPIPHHPLAYGAASLALATIVQVVIAGPFYPNALKGLIFDRAVEMDLLIVLSTSTAYIFSVVSFAYIAKGQPLSTGDFFETSTLLVTLIIVGKFISALARQKAVESISIHSLQAHTALLVSSNGTKQREIDTRLLQYGDIFKAIPNSRIPTDGIVISGSSEVDESMITGESMPVEKSIGSSIIAGSLNGSGTLTVRLTRLPGDNTITTIAGMIDEAKLSKPKVQDIADRVAGYFVPVVVTLSAITLAIWLAVGIMVRKQTASEAIIQSLTYAITVLIVSCPCAIGLAVPMVIVIAGGVAAEQGVIIKSPDALELAWKATHVVFDKTGTLTQGKMGVVVEEYLAGNRDDISPLVLGLLSNVNHPVSLAVTKHLKALGIATGQIEQIKSLTGKGVEGLSGEIVIRAGNSRWLKMESNPRVQSLLSQGYTVFCVVIGSELSAIFGLEDTLRPDSMTTVEELQKRGVTVSIVSGDDDGAVRVVAQKLGITNIRSKCSPGDKQEYLKEIMKSREAVTIFCGDGTNDAVALAQATIGVHVNEGTEVAQSASDIVLVRPSLAGIISLMDISKASVHRIVFNFSWSFVYNLFAILLAAGAFVHVRIPPEFAGLGELVSVLPVVLIALQLKWANIGNRDLKRGAQ